MVRTLFILILFYAVLFPIRLPATTYIVGPDEEYRSISAAVNAVDLTDEGEDTVLVRAGTYGPSYFSKSGGSEGKMLTIKNYPGDLPEINGWNGTTLNGSQGFTFAENAGFFRIEGFYVTGFRNGIVSVNWATLTDEEKRTVFIGSNIELRYNVVDLCGRNGMSVFFSKDIIFECNLVSRTGWESPDQSWSSGINLLGVGGTILVRNNVSFHHIDISSHRSDGNGFIVDQAFSKVTSCIFENNLAFLNGGSGFGTNSSATISYIGNTTYNNWQDDDFGNRGAGISFSNTESRNTIAVKNNLCIQTNRGEGIIVYGASTTSLSGVGTNFTSQSSNDASAIFMDADNCDFRIDTGAVQVIGQGDTEGIAVNDIGFDPNAIKREAPPSGLANIPSFFIFAPDIDYIRSKGGLSGCFNPATRKSPPTLGAYEYVDPMVVSKNIPESGRNFLSPAVRFNPDQTSVSISFSRPITTSVSLIDLHGRTAYSSGNRYFRAGIHSFPLTRQCTGGIYLLRISCNYEKQTKVNAVW